MANPLQFLQDVRQETAKVSWPNRQETLITTVLVVVMCVLASAFFAFSDQLIRFVINLIFNIGR